MCGKAKASRCKAMAEAVGFKANANNFGRNKAKPNIPEFIIYRVITKSYYKVSIYIQFKCIGLVYAIIGNISLITKLSKENLYQYH